MAALIFGCSLSNAEPRPQILRSYLAEHNYHHEFVCHSYSAEIFLRSVGPDRSNPTRVSFEAAKFNEQRVSPPKKINEVFEFFNYTESIFGECIDQEKSVGVVIVATAKPKGYGRLRLYLTINNEGVRTLDLVCPRKSTEFGSNLLDELCTAEK